jgi:predicted AAA+ superfamily ATPase
MSDYSRPILKELINRVQEPRRFIQVFYGPRQVGKTFLMHQIQSIVGRDKCLIYNGDEASGIDDWLNTIWESARIKLKLQDQNELVLIFDEIQKIDRWSERIKALWDKDSADRINIKVVLTGSSRLLLQQGLTESMAGRFETVYIPHWSYREMKAAFGYTLDQHIVYGAYPAVADLVGKDEPRAKNYVRESIIESVINRDILMMQRIDKPVLLRNLFELGSSYSSQIMSYSKIMGALSDAGNTTTLTHYAKLLDTAGMLTPIEKYANTLIRQRASIPKWQIQNNAFMWAYSKDGKAAIINNPERWGRWIESAAGAHLINCSKEKKWQLFYWRENNAEVDFVLSHRDQLVCLEVKSNYSSNMDGIRSFKKSFLVHRSYLIGPKGLSVEEFLLLDPLELF